jgi:hypothetical protein
MFKKNDDVRNQILELIVEGQIDRQIFPKKSDDKDYAKMVWTINALSLNEDKMQCSIPVMNIITKKIYKNTGDVQYQEGLYDYEVHELCISGKKFYDGSRYAYVDYEGQPIIHKGHYKNHSYPHKPSYFRAYPKIK